MPKYEVYGIVIWLVTGLSSTQGQEVLHVLGTAPYSGDWTNGDLVKFASSLALEHVNSRPDILPGYNLSVIWMDSKCDGGLGTYLLCQYVHQPPIKFMLLGDSCSPATKALAAMSHHFNLTQISADSTTPALSDKSVYPNFFRLWGSDTSKIPVWLALLRHFKWKRASLIYKASLPEVPNLMVPEMAKENISLVLAEVYQKDPRDRLDVLKKHDSKIIILQSYEKESAQILCKGLQIGMAFPKVVWIIPAWHNDKWWLKEDIQEDIECTKEELTKAVIGTIYIGTIHETTEPDELGVSGFSQKELEAMFIERLKRDKLGKPEDMFAYYERVYFYDWIWIVALALNATEEELVKIGKKRLINFTYSDWDMAQLIKSKVSSLKFIGSKGYFEFDENGDPKESMKVEQEQEGGRKLVAVYRRTENGESKFEWRNGGIQWPGGKVPTDATILILKRDFLNRYVYIVLCSVANIGIITAVIFLAFNVVFRKKREIKMSSPNLNNIILLGCVICYITIFLNTQTEEQAHLNCTLWPMTLTLGMSLTLGALLSKTWRVYVIFRSKTAKNVSIQDLQLIGFVIGFVVINLFILVLWAILDPYEVVYLNTFSEDLVQEEQDVTVQHQVAVCFSKYSFYFSGTLYIVQGLLLVFGAFLAWETRKVRVEALNDSQLIGTCIYNVFILSTLGVGLSVALKNETLLVSTITSIFLLVATFSTMVVIFIPKIVKIIRGKADVIPSTVGSAGGTSGMEVQK